MITKTIKELYDLIGSPFVFDPNITDYPEIEGNTSNFLTDYNTHKDIYDKFFVREYGERFIDLFADNDADAVTEFKEDLEGILRLYLDSWARLYYSLNIAYNPVYNVEEHTLVTYSEHETTDAYGQDQTTDAYGQDRTTDAYGQHQRTEAHGAREHTDGTRTDNSTLYNVAYDSTTEKETSKQTDAIGSQTSNDAAYTDTMTDASATDTHTRDSRSDTHTRGARTDKSTSGEHTTETDRSGNIGVVSATDLLINEEKFRRRYSFFKNCFLTIITEVGAYYDSIIL